MSAPRPPVRSLSEDEITELVAELAQPVRIASLSPNGFPLISTLWFLYEGSEFWCITQSRTLLRRNLAANPRARIPTEYAIRIRPRRVRDSN